MKFTKPSEIKKAAEENRNAPLDPDYKYKVRFINHPEDDDKPERPYYGFNYGGHVVCLSLIGKCPFCDHFKKEK